MHSELAQMIESVARLRDASATSAPSEALVAEMEAALTTGYAWALAADGCSMRIEERLHEAVTDPSGHAAAELGGKHARLREDLMTPRQALAGLRSDRDRVRMRLPARSG